jgi:Mce-associated membrane protein
VTSETRARSRDEEVARTSVDPGDDPTGAIDAGTPAAVAPDAGAGAGVSGDGAGAGVSGDGGSEGGRRGRGRISVRLVPALSVLLVLLLGAVAYLWFSRPEESAIRTGDYAAALQAARSGVVDLTSFDYLTLDDDIEQARRVSTGDLREESVAQLDQRRQEITDLQAVVNTEVVGAGVTRADGEDATVLLVIQSTQESAANPQAQIVRYRIEVTLEKSDGRWLLSGIKGTEAPGND